MVPRRQWPAALIDPPPFPTHENIVVQHDLHEVPQLKSNTFLVLTALGYSISRARQLHRSNEPHNGKRALILNLNLLKPIKHG
jgi:hypothetical protein